MKAKLLDPNWKYVPASSHSTENVVKRTIARERRRIAEESSRPANVSVLKRKEVK